jgi:hypothetical protein
MPSSPGRFHVAVQGPGDEADRRRYRLLTEAARDLARLDSAYQAELLVSTLLGSVYEFAGKDRAGEVERFTAGFGRYLSRRRGPDAVLLRAVLSSLLPAGRPVRTPVEPAWVAQLGGAKPTGAWVYGDQYRDQVSYLATFGYADAELGGPEHVVVVLVDHNLGAARDLFVTSPAAAVLDHLRGSVTDDTTYLRAIDPAGVRGAAAPYLAATDELPSLPESGSLASDRMVALARLRLLPESAAPPAADLPPRTTDPASAFRASPEADALVGAPGDAASLAFCLDLIIGYAATRLDRDPLRWSPAAVTAFLLDWAPRQALLDATDQALLPRVLDAWARWAGRIRDLSPRAVAETVVTIAQVKAEFVERSRSGEHRSAQVRAVAAMLADGVDPDDTEAVARWLDAYNAREEPG